MVVTEALDIASDSTSLSYLEKHIMLLSDSTSHRFLGFHLLPFKECPAEWFSSFTVYQDPLEGWLGSTRRVSDSVALWGALRCCVADRFASDAPICCSEYSTWVD